MTRPPPLLGVKLVLTEFSAFIRMGAMPVAEIDNRTRMIMTYALCGFANIASVGINVAGYSVLVPERRQEVMGMVWKAMIAGFLATCMTAAVVGAMPRELFGNAEGMSITPPQPPMPAIPPAPPAEAPPATAP